MFELPCVIREYEPADRDTALDLVNRVFAGAFQHYEPKTPAWWRWKFDEAPSGHRSLVVFDPSGSMVGFYGGLLLDVAAKGRRFSFAQSVDTVVDPAFRRGLKNPGLFVRLTQAYESTFAGPDRAAVMYGLPIPNAYRIGARFMDYWMLRAQAAFVFRSMAHLPPADPALEVREVERFPRDITALAQRTFSPGTWVGRRDEAWLNWRFPPQARDPYRRWLVFHRTSGELLAAMVFRVVHFLGRDVVAIVDALAPADAAAAHGLLVRRLQEEAARLGRDLVTLAPPTSAWAALLVRHGFRAEPTLYVMVGRPFHPDLAPDELREHWHYTLADLDVL